MAKKFGIALLVLLLVLGGVGYYVYENFSGFVKGAIQKYGSEATQTAVRLDSVSVSLSDGEAKLNGLKIANPDGYGGGDAIDLGAIGVKIDSASVKGDGPIIIKEVNIEAPVIDYQRKLTTSNLDVIKANVNAYARGATGSGEGPQSAKDSRKVIIDNLYVRNGKVTVSDAMVQQARATAELPLIHMTGIGRAEGGATQAQVAEQVLQVLTTSAITVGAGAFTSNLGALGGSLLNKSSNKSGGLKGLLGK